MRTLITIAALIWVMFSIYGQENSSSDDSKTTFEVKLNAMRPSDTLLINEHISNALSEAANNYEKAEILLIAGHISWTTIITSGRIVYWNRASK